MARRFPADREILTKTDFVQAFEALLKQILEIENRLIQKNERRMDVFKQRIDNWGGKTPTEMSREISNLSKEIEKIRKEHYDFLDYAKGIVSKLTSGQDGLDGIDGKTPTRQELVALIKPLIPKVELPKLDEVKKDIEELKGRPVGGGVTNLRIIQAFKYILKTEKPSGAIDGVNTIYIVSQPIFAVLAFSLNKAVIAQLPNYTISGGAITFASPLPASYAGKDFEVKYV